MTKNLKEHKFIVKEHVLKIFYVTIYCLLILKQLSAKITLKNMSEPYTHVGVHGILNNIIFS